MKLSEMDIGKTEQSKLEAVGALYGRDVIVKDSHSRWLNGYLEEHPTIMESYKLRTEDGPRILHYKYLEELLVVD